MNDTNIIKLKNGLIILILLLAFCIVIIPAEAATDLKITSTNLKALQTEGTWKSYGSGELLVSQSTKNLYVPYQKSIWVSEINAYGLQAADYEGKRYGQCVSLVKSLSESTTPANSWKRGRKVTDLMDVKPGTVIATFNSAGKYTNKPGQSHVAIFKAYVLDSKGNLGINVWDQNWVGQKKYQDSTGLIGRHSIMPRGTKTHNANNYYVVQA